jgi:hypothetical protein
MLPVLGREVVEGEQRVAIPGEAIGDLLLFDLVAPSCKSRWLRAFPSQSEMDLYRYFNNIGVRTFILPGAPFHRTRVELFVAGPKG